ERPQTTPGTACCAENSPQQACGCGPCSSPQAVRWRPSPWTTLLEAALTRSGPTLACRRGITPAQAVAQVAGRKDARLRCSQTGSMREASLLRTDPTRLDTSCQLIAGPGSVSTAKASSEAVILGSSHALVASSPSTTGSRWWIFSSPPLAWVVTIVVESTHRCGSPLG